jgi:NAD(P)-dependent dehydrogenase (short-subunit alcohol dehydrogenase family)
LDYVIVTGTSTGLGKVMVHYLAARGFVVIAGVRKQADGDALVASAPKSVASRIKPVILDVVKQQEIEAAVLYVQQELKSAGPGANLIGVVNNAGIVQMDPVELEDMEKVKQQFDVNLFGAMAMTRAFLPVLRETTAARGHGSARILFLGSLIQDTIAPFYGCYGATKSALESWGDALRCEIQPQGILVSHLQPGMFFTELITKSKEDCLKHIVSWENTTDPKIKDISSHYLSKFKMIVDWYHSPPKSPLEWVSGEVDAALRTWSFASPNKRVIGWDSFSVAPLTIAIPEEILARIFASSMKPAPDIGLQKMIDTIVKYNPPFQVYGDDEKKTK